MDASFPNAQQLGMHAMRQFAGAALVVLAAAIVHAFGFSDQRWQYVAIAAALVPQILIDLMAVRLPERRRKLRVSHRPAAMASLAAVALAVTAVTALMMGEPVASGTAALVAGAGLAIAAAPQSVAIVPAAKA